MVAREENYVTNVLDENNYYHEGKKKAYPLIGSFDLDKYCNSNESEIDIDEKSDLSQVVVLCSTSSSVAESNILEHSFPPKDIIISKESSLMNKIIETTNKSHEKIVIIGAPSFTNSLEKSFEDLKKESESLLSPNDFTTCVNDIPCPDKRPAGTEWALKIMSATVSTINDLRSEVKAVDSIIGNIVNLEGNSRNFDLTTKRPSAIGSLHIDFDTVFPVKERQSFCAQNKYVHDQQSQIGNLNDSNNLNEISALKKVKTKRKSSSLRRLQQSLLQPEALEHLELRKSMKLNYNISDENEEMKPLVLDESHEKRRSLRFSPMNESMIPVDNNESNNQCKPLRSDSMHEMNNLACCEGDRGRISSRRSQFHGKRRSKSLRNLPKKSLQNEAILENERSLTDDENFRRDFYSRRQSSSLKNLFTRATLFGYEEASNTANLDMQTGCAKNKTKQVPNRFDRIDGAENEKSRRKLLSDRKSHSFRKSNIASHQSTARSVRKKSMIPIIANLRNEERGFLSNSDDDEPLENEHLKAKSRPIRHKYRASSSSSTKGNASRKNIKRFDANEESIEEKLPIKEACRRKSCIKDGETLWQSDNFGLGKRSPVRVANGRRQIHRQASMPTVVPFLHETTVFYSSLRT